MSQSQQRPPQYVSYLLRLWETRDGDQQIWRASLQCPHTGQRHGFACLRDLFDFLQAQTEYQNEEADRTFPDIL